ncbi:unnamed protein product, partial [Coregonus sp. 'balchen']
ISTKSVPKQFDLLVLSIKLSNSSLLTVAGCYRPPSAPACTLNALSSLLAPYTKSEFVLLGSAPGSTVICQSYSTSRIPFGEMPMRNKCIQAIRKAKVSYFKEQFSLCGSNPKKFWTTVKDLENKPSSSQLPMSLNVDDVVVTDKQHMAELFNHHFI